MNNIEIAKLAVELVKLDITNDLSKENIICNSIEELFEKYFKKIKETIDK